MMRLKNRTNLAQTLHFCYKMSNMTSICIIGCGNMGLIYARAFLKYKMTEASSLFLAEKDPQRAAELRRQELGVVIEPATMNEIPGEVIILAVKPQDFLLLAPQLRGKIQPEALVLSIMAGVEICKIQQLLGHDAVVRAMPNSPVEVGMGMTVFSSDGKLDAAHILRTEHLLSASGRTLYLENEALLDAVTALSGSGPAYFFYFLQQLIAAGVEMGLPEHVAETLARQTMLGSFHLINNAGKPLPELIGTVASRGGTTEAALSTFTAGEMDKTIIQALKNAEARARELSARL